MSDAFLSDTRPDAIVVRGVKKEYRMGRITAWTLQGELQERWAKLRGKENPNTRVGADTSRYGEKFWALGGIDLTVKQGEAVGIIGPNGAGKSTLLKILCRVTAPTEGEIDIYGRITSMLEVGTGFHSEMTGRQNIYMNGTILGMTKKEVDEVMSEIVEFSEIGEFLDTPVKRYSSGMRVKLAFAVAAHLKSEIMIMDEVLAVGDMAFQNKCLTKMREAADRENRTILYVSHNMNTIRRLCDRVIVLDRGNVIYDGNVDAGIAMYMENALGENLVDIDLTKAPRGKSTGDCGVRMTRLRLSDRDIPSYQAGETLRLLLNTVSDRDRDVLLRLTLRTDSDAGLGTSWSEAFRLRAGERETDVQMSLGGIEKGVFYGSLGLYELQADGTRKSLDHITRAFRFEVPGSYTWSTDSYGYVSLGEIRVKGSPV